MGHSEVGQDGGGQSQPQGSEPSTQAGGSGGLSVPVGPLHLEETGPACGVAAPDRAGT